MIRYEQVITATQQSIFSRVLVSVAAAGCRDNRSGGLRGRWRRRQRETDGQPRRVGWWGGRKGGVKIEI